MSLSSHGGGEGGDGCEGGGDGGSPSHTLQVFLHFSFFASEYFLHFLFLHLLSVSTHGGGLLGGNGGEDGDGGGGDGGGGGGGDGGGDGGGGGAALAPIHLPRTERVLLALDALVVAFCAFVFAFVFAVGLSEALQELGSSTAV